MNEITKSRMKHYTILVAGSFIAALMLVLAYKYMTAGYSIKGMIDAVVLYPLSFLRNMLAGTVCMFGIAFLIFILFQAQHGRWKPLAPISLYLLLGLLAGLLTVFLTLAQYGMDIRTTGIWLKAHPYHFIISVAFVYSIVLFLFALFGSYYAAAVASILVLCGIAAAHYFKLKVLGEPLYPIDFKQIKQVQELAPMVMESLSIWYVFLAIPIIALLIFARKWMPKYRIHRIHRILLLGLSGLLLWSYYNFQSSFLSSLSQKANITFIDWSQIANYETNGFIIGLLTNLNQEVFEKPTDYTKEHVIAVAEKIAEEANMNEQTATEAVPKQPNIIYIMNEAFWDPTLLYKATFSEDPIPFVRGLMDRGIHGQHISPSFGGATANVEFEALTGFSMSFLKQGATPYQQAVENQASIPTMASIMKEQGYETAALHAFKKSFYKRTIVYDVFGFDYFIGMDDMKHTDLSGEFISDLSVSKELVDMLNSSDKPMFVHAVTMQNHFPYVPKGRYTETQVKVEGLSEEHNGILETYTEGVREASAALKYLSDELQKLDEPTMVIFWGDHLPALGVNKSLYREDVFIYDEKTTDEMRRLYQTPLVMLSNFPLEPRDLGAMSPAYLSPTVLDILQAPQPPYYEFLEQVKQEIPGLHRDFQLGSGYGRILEPSDKQKELLEAYRLIQYDLLIGKQYSKDILFSVQ